MTRKGRLKNGDVVAVGCMLVFLLCTVAWGQDPRGGSVSKDALPSSLKGLVIQDVFVPTRGFQEAARIEALEGHVVVIHRASGRAYFGREGDPIFENDALETLEDSRCRIHFKNEDVVSMAEKTRFGVDGYRDREEGREKSFLSMLKGKALFYALRLFGHEKRRFDVKTPTAVVGVRGTKFGVAVHWIEETSAQAAPGVRVADRSGALDPRLAQGPPSGKSYTDCHSEDGTLDVGGTIVEPGQMYRGRDGDVVPTPPEVVRAFREATAVRGGEGKGEDEEEDEDEGESFVGLSAGPDRDFTPPDPSDMDPPPVPPPPPPGTAGRISGIMTILVDNSGYAWGSYEYGPNPLGPGPNQHVAYETDHDEDPDHRLVLQEQDAEGTKATVSEFTDGTSVPVSGRTFTYFKGGSYTDASGREYLEWGWWEDLGSGSKGLVADDGTDFYYAATHKIWHVEGLRTHPDYIDYLHQQGARFSYAGETKGVFVEDGVGAVELTGPFSCQVDFGSRSVKDIHIQSSNAGYFVNLNGSGSLGSDGEIDIDNLSGTLESPTAGTKTAVDTGGGGVIMGPKADGIAGAWDAHDGGSLWATGQFYGKR